jgi:hypothetical protein
MQRTGQRPCADVPALRLAGHRRPDVQEILDEHIAKKLA